MSATPYRDAAWLYHEQGWKAPIPVGYGPRKKSPPIKGYTGWTGVDPSGADIETWRTGPEAAWNIALHVTDGLLDVDVDAYHGGDKTMAQLAVELGVPLPRTWTSTSRGQGDPSRHHLFKAELPAGRRWVSHPGGEGSGVDNVHTGHRFAVTWPSVHPDSGELYRWYDPEGELYEGVPNVDWLPVLDPVWVLALSQEGDVITGDAADYETTRATVRRFRKAPACKRVDTQLGRELDRLKAATRDVGGIHSPGPLFGIVALGFEGHAGVQEALSHHQEAHWAARVVRDGVSKEKAEAEWLRMLFGAVGKLLAKHDGAVDPGCDCAGTRPERADPWGVDERNAPDEERHAEPDRAVGLLPTLPDTFWAARPYLTQIREYAHSLAVSADVVLYTLLARLSGMLPPAARTHTMIKDPAGASLNLFVSVFDASSAGKSSAAGAGDGVLMTYAMPGGFIDGVSVGSGQGIPELYMDEVEEEREPDPATGKPRKGRGKTVRKQVRHNAYVYVDEGHALVANMQASGSVLGPTIRTAWIGGTLGQANATKERYRHVAKGTYSLGMVVGFQRSTVGPLIEDAVAGTPQRFAWVSAADPGIPATAEPVGRFQLIWDPSSLTGGLAVEAAIRQRLRADDHEKVTGRRVVHTLDGHRNLMLVKFAGLLCILDKRTEIDESDWALAETMWATSCAVRDAVVGQLAGARREAAEQQQVAYVRREMAVMDAREERADKTVVRTARLIARYVHAADEPLTPAAAKHKLRSDRREGFDDGLGYAVEAGWVVEDDDLLKPGPSKPSDG